ncbi:MAG TPA: hypothetical protein P5230_02575 [Candidatus Magasanikbacteria bacterium]|nr:hypothetical protein [Candidatus Magasanikbacteria bacterium]
MKSFFKKFIFGAILFSILILPLSVCFADETADQKAAKYGVQKVYNNSLLSLIGISNQEPLDIIQGLVRLVLGFVGIVLMVLIIYAGFTWIKARDNSGEVDKAKDIIESAIYGIVIVVLAYGISEFIFSRLTSSP